LAVFFGDSGKAFAGLQDPNAGSSVDPAKEQAAATDRTAAATENGQVSITKPEDSGSAPALFSEQWIKDVDAWFGKYLVTPLGKVLFFPIYKHDAKDDAGNVVATVQVPLIVIWLLVGATFFTIFFGFINIRGFWHAIRLTSGYYDDPEDTGEVSHFQALSSALSGTVGLGNIAGVAIAIAQGGPGATFWMILIGLLGMSSKFTECTLGQIYRKVDPGGRISGGPMRYLSQGLSEKGLAPIGYVLAFLFALLCIGGSLGGGNTFQISQSLDVIKTEVPIINQHPWIYGAIMCLLVGLVIVGGIKSIGRVAGKIVPFMCAGYVICAIVVLITNWEHIGTAFSRIWSEAFNAHAMYGGFLGCLVIGIKRAVFSNEAGAGSASIAHSAAKTEIPVREGYVALLEPFIDTVIVCTMTALVIIITGVVDDPEHPVPLSTIAQELRLLDMSQDDIDALGENRDQAEKLLIEMNPDIDKLPDGTLRMSDYIALDRGAYFTKEAFVKSGHAWFKWFLYVAVILFAFSTCITWYYYGERCFTTLLGQWSSPLYKIIFLTFTFLGSIVATTNIKDFSDMLILGMAFPNMLGMYFMCGKVKGQLRAYQADLKSGKYDR
jgi:AGCS family alanine or glycine:cation symporter